MRSILILSILVASGLSICWGQDDYYLDTETVHEVINQPAPPPRTKPGVDGSYRGEGGTDAAKPANAGHSGNVDLYISAADDLNGKPGYEFLVITEHPETKQLTKTKYFFSKDGKDKIFISTEGIAGADSAKAGKGAKGEDGPDGDDANRMFDGTDGGDGYKGGPGGRSWDGGLGGNAARTRVFLDEEHLEALNLIDDKSAGVNTGVVKGGSGGKADNSLHGEGGAGGDGGKGGDSHSWTTQESYTDADGNTKYETKWHSNDGGRDGYQGPTGDSPNMTIKDGAVGQDNVFEIHAKNKSGKTDIYRKGKFKYDVKIERIGSADRAEGGIKDGMIEHGEQIEVDVKVTNVGEMESPKNSKILVGIDFGNSKNIKAGDNSITTVSIDESLKPGESVILTDNKELRAIVFEEGKGFYPLIEDGRKAEFKLGVASFQLRKSQIIDSQTVEFKPVVSIKKVFGANSLLPGESTEIAFKIENNSNVNLGRGEEMQRYLGVQFEQMLGGRHSGDELDAGDLIFIDEEGNEKPLSEVFAKEVNSLKGKEEILLTGKIKLSEKAIEAYKTGTVVTRLQLGSIQDFNVTQDIWERDFKVQVAKPFELSTDHKNPTKLIIITNNQTSNAELKFYQDYADKLEIHLADYNVSLEGGIDWEKIAKAEGAGVVVLNNSYDSIVEGIKPAELLTLKDSFITLYDYDDSNRIAFIGPEKDGVDLGRRILPNTDVEARPTFESTDEFQNSLVKGEASTSVLGYNNVDQIEVEAGFFKGGVTEDKLEQAAQNLAEELEQKYPERRFIVSYDYNPRKKKAVFGLFKTNVSGDLNVYRTVDKARSDFLFLDTSQNATKDAHAIAKEKYFTLFNLNPVGDLLSFLETKPDEIFDLSNPMGQALKDSILSQMAREITHGIDSKTKDPQILFKSFFEYKNANLFKDHSGVKEVFVNELISDVRFMVNPDNSTWKKVGSWLASAFVTDDSKTNYKKLVEIVSKTLPAEERSQTIIKELEAEKRKKFRELELKKPDVINGFANGSGAYLNFETGSEYFTRNKVMSSTEIKELNEEKRKIDQRTKVVTDANQAGSDALKGKPLTPEQSDLCKKLFKWFRK
ncbi:hypothetical protein N9N67_06865 [Bacteriovoracaceae bacterium]|nr:hypothetical protein [Bacteriovoracaceae bacterium]